MQHTLIADRTDIRNVRAFLSRALSGEFRKLDARRTVSLKGTAGVLNSGRVGFSFPISRVYRAVS